MGFLDNIQSSLNRGVAATSRATSTVKLKAQMADALHRRQQLAAQLGASLYEATRDNPELRAGREALYDGIAACDEERARYQEQIDALEAESADAAQAAVTYTCPFCGARVGNDDLFCSGCGKPITEVKAELYARQQAQAPRPPQEADEQ